MLIFASLLLGCLVYSFLASLIWSIFENYKVPTEYDRWLNKVSQTSIVKPAVGRDS